MEAKQLLEVVSRLEAVASKLEKCGVAAPAAADAGEESEDYPEVQAYDEAFKPAIDQMLESAKAIDGELVEMTQLVANLVLAIRRLVVVGCRCSKPDNNAQFAVIAELSNQGLEWCDKHFRTKHVNHLKAVHEAMTLFTYPTIGASAEQYAVDMTGSVQCYTNKLLMEYRGKDENQTKWAQGLVKACKAIPTFVNDYEKGGFKFNARGPKATPEMFKLDAGKGAAAAAPAPAAAPAAAPAPAPAPKKEEPAAPKGPAGKAALLGAKLAGIGPKAAPKTPSVKRIGQSSQVQAEYYTSGSPSFDEVQLKHEDIVNIFQCKNSEITIPSKVKAISILNCERCIISPNDVIGTLELNGVKKTKIYIEGTVKTITCDKCDSLEIYLNPQSCGLQLISSLSTGINLEYPDPNEEGNYIEHAVPEQIKVQFNADRKLEHQVYVHE